MTICIVLSNWLFAILLYFINGLLGGWKREVGIIFEYGTFSFGDDVTNANFSGNFFQKIIHPAIYLAIICVFLQHFAFLDIAKELWLVVPFYWLFCFLHHLIWNRISFINWKYEFISFGLSILLSEGTLFYIIRPLIESGKTVFIELVEFRDAFWFAVFTYLAKIIWDISKVNFSKQNVFPPDKCSKTIFRRYKKFEKKYNSIIEYMIAANCKFRSEEYKKHFLCLLYAIMIYEDYCRPATVRCAEYLSKIILWNRKMSLGIMQMQTDKLIGSKKSIELAILKLYKIYSSTKNSNKLRSSIIDYNPSDTYYTEVIAIYEELRNLLNLDELYTGKVKINHVNQQLLLEMKRAKRES